MQYKLESSTFTFDLNKDRISIGSSPQADITIESDLISSLHAFIVSENESVYLVDLVTPNGTFVNGEKVDQKASLLLNDTVSFANTHFHLAEAFFEGEFISEEIKELPTLTESKIIIPSEEERNLQLIDDEFCDIVFDDTKQGSFNDAAFNFDNANYVDTESLEDPFAIAQENSGETQLQITVAINGIILDQYYYNLKAQKVLASSNPNDKHITLPLDNKEKVSICEIKGGKILFPEGQEFELNNNLNHKINFGICEILFTTIDSPKQIANIPFWLRQKDFFKQSGKQIAGTFCAFLLLLLVDFSIEKKEEKKIAIIYKKPVETFKKDSTLTSKEQTTHKKPGQKQKQVKKKLAHKKKGVKKKMVAKKAPAKPTKPAPKKLSSLTSKFASLTKSSKAIQVNRSPSSVSTSSQSAQVTDTNIATTSSLNVGKMGLDSMGSTQSYGTKGLASKRPRETAYIQTKTVVLGSMDPELLRKILQQYLPQFRHCYQQELAYNSDSIKGVVNLDFEISAAGEAGKINILAKKAKFSKKGVNCMSKVLSIISFPKPKGGGRVAVRQPLNFFAEQENS